jgi:hypothetical protein
LSLLPPQRRGENDAQIARTNQPDAPDASIAFGSPVSMIRHRFGGHLWAASAKRRNSRVVIAF